MTSKYESDNTTRSETLSEDQRYAAFRDGAGSVVVYDTRNGNAWIQADCAVDIDGMA
ncbi:MULTISPECIES: DUF7331 family protein [Halorussus]|uniref:DUF7331 family protein n=1 Tax=Halorussus TaxID=1070314 RepID=UPI00209E34BA|nr:hypothetical protein [Halorussus vallis]USZ76554.1 hypothetical protein NGM07_04315 [Halorussus vallis]